MDLPALLEEIEALAAECDASASHSTCGCFRVCADRLRDISRRALTLPAPPMFVPTLPPDELPDEVA